MPVSPQRTSSGACGRSRAGPSPRRWGWIPGPVHVNFPFDKPLEPAELAAEQAVTLRAADPVGLDGHADGTPLVPVVEGEAGPTQGDVRAVASALAAGGRGLIVAGPVTDPQAVGPAIEDLARGTGFPVLGDPLSGVRFSEHGAEHSVTAYDLFLRGISPRATSPSREASHDAKLREVLRPDIVCRIGGRTDVRFAFGVPGRARGRPAG